MRYTTKKQEDITVLSLKEEEDGVTLIDKTHFWSILKITNDGHLIRCPGIGENSGLKLDERKRIMEEN